MTLLSLLHIWMGSVCHLRPHWVRAAQILIDFLHSPALPVLEFTVWPHNLHHFPVHLSHRQHECQNHQQHTPPVLQRTNVFNWSYANRWSQSVFHSLQYQEGTCCGGKEKHWKWHRYRYFHYWSYLRENIAISFLMTSWHRYGDCRPGHNK